MTERPARYSSRSHRPADPTQAQIAASLAFQMPSAPTPEPETPPQTAPAALHRSELVKRVLAHPGNRQALYGLVIGSLGPEAFSDQALEAMGRIVDAIDLPLQGRGES